MHLEDFSQVRLQAHGRSARPPQVSVCIPTYRGAATIEATIRSVLEQDFTDFEIIVVDDSSPDNTAQLFQQFDDPRLIYVRNTGNQGAEGAWNRCLELARGQYFKLLPHDDLLLPGCLRRQVDAFEADSGQQLALVFCARQVIDPTGRRLTDRGLSGQGNGVIAALPLMRACMRRGTNLIGEPGGVLMRRELARRVGGFDATHPYVIDLDYWFRLLDHGNAYYDPEPLVAFRVSRTQWSVVIGTRQSADFKNFIARAASRHKITPTFLDRLLGRFTPSLNNLARLIFYRLYLRHPKSAS